MLKDIREHIMAITVNLRYTGKDGAARKFAQEMMTSGSVAAIRAEEGNKLATISHSYDVVSDIPEGSVIITNFDHVCAVMSYYRPDCQVLLYEAEIDKLLPDMQGNITDNVHDLDIEKLVSSQDKEVYFWGSFNSREEIVESWTTLGINNELMDNILIERYWINVYKLSGAVK